MFEVFVGSSVLLLTLYVIAVKYDLNNLVWKRLIMKYSMKRTTIIAFILYICTDILLKILFGKSMIYEIINNIIIGLFVHLLIYVIFIPKEDKK